MKKTCPECSPQVGKRRASRVKQRIEAGRKTAWGRDKAMIYTVVTVPPELRDRFRDRKEWRKVVREFWAVLRTMYGGKFAVECSHNVGDDSPDFHPHANFLWIQRDGYRPYLNLEALRDSWRRILATYTIPVVYSSYTYSKNQKKESHRFRYVTRVMEDPDLWIGPLRWYGEYPRVKYAEAPAVCPKCGECFLFLGPSSMEEYLLQESSIDSS